VVYIASNNNNKFLKPLDGKLKKHKIYGFDIETYCDTNEFLMGSIVNSDLSEKYVFWDKQRMIDFILKSDKLKNSRIFATNLSFDFLGLFGDNFNLLEKFQYCIRGSDFISIKLNRKNKTVRKSIEFQDTFSYARFSVKLLGKIISLPKLAKPKGLGRINPSPATTEGKYMQEYNIRDSQISAGFAEFLQDSFYNLGCNMKLTIASTAMDLWLRKYLDRWIMQPPKEQIEELREGYYGGRTEAFYRGQINNTRLYLYDINSLYPYVMKARRYPVPDSVVIITDNTDIKYIMNYEGLSYCSIQAPKIMYPLLPLRTTDDNKLLFPAGEFEGWHTHAELRKALSIGYKIRYIKKTYYYKMTFSPFYRYVTDMYDLRLKYKQEKSPMQLPVKILLNSLYGKFAQRLHNMEIVFDQDMVAKCLAYNNEHNKQRYKIDSPHCPKSDIPIPKDIIKEHGLPENSVYDTSRMFFITDTESDRYSKFINPILSIYITSYARLELYKWIEKVISTASGGKVFYCDTDSVITDIKLPEDTGLGMMKLEKTITDLIIVRPKLYFYRTIEGNEYSRAKGIHGSLSYSEFTELVKTGKHKSMKFSKFKESLRRNISFNTKIDIVKHLDLEDKKRDWDNNLFCLNKFEKSKPKFFER